MHPIKPQPVFTSLHLSYVVRKKKNCLLCCTFALDMLWLFLLALYNSLLIMLVPEPSYFNNEGLTSVDTLHL